MRRCLSSPLLVRHRLVRGIAGCFGCLLPIVGAWLLGTFPAAAGLAAANWLDAGLTPGAQCRAAIGRAERAYRLPPHLLAAIGRVESGRPSPDGGVDPWPYSINVEGADTVFETKAAAVAGVRAALAGGARSIDVGCMQVNLKYHPEAFASLEEAFDPWRNADYAARFLVQLRADTGSWETATADYHSATPEVGGPYAVKVRAALTEEAGGAPTARLAGAAEGTPAGSPPLRVSAFGRPALGMGRAMGFANAGGARSMGRLLPIAGGGIGLGLAAYRGNPTSLAAVALRR